jgi:hypothetical protein
MRKSGFWQITLSTGIEGSSSTEKLKVRQCIDNTPELLHQDSMLMRAARKACSKIDARKTTTGYTINAECLVDTHTVNMLAQVTGDFNTTYTMDQTATITDPNNKVIRTVMTGKGEWLGACPSEWKAGDGEMPNIRKTSGFPVGTLEHILVLSMSFANLFLNGED